MAKLLSIALNRSDGESFRDFAPVMARADRTTAPLALLAYELLRRERVAQVQRGARENGLRYDSAYSDLGSGTPRSPRMPRSASGSMITMWSRTRKPRRQRRGSCLNGIAGLLKRRPPPGWRPQWRRSGPTGARSGTVRRAAMNATVASRKFLPRQRNNRSAKKSAEQKHGPARAACRGRGENSNAAIVRSMIGSGFIAAFQSATVEIFSAKIEAERGMRLPNRYAGANPKVRSKRLA